MRVISGEFRGRQLKSIAGTNTRPTSDKIKESIFHILGPYFGGGTCLDLFAGSGSLGIEAISRGMDSVVFVEKSSPAIRVINQNVDLVKMNAVSKIYKNDANRALQILSKKDNQFDLIFLDPPYEKVDYDKLIDQIIAGNILSSLGRIYIEHSPEKEFTFNKQQLEKVYEKKYNATTSITILQNRV
ncbi:16S rRNA (guanine(966)-N(2))-methyltransferase RsmD [Pseudogracilibacillus sp. SE30717A]|uniref:16S rRNA (guanine(966)-N(2))-methyltransferase RsmD n=1 Tax=Pseudogracilibacillus sp. SE30717A TaxID=3098293 RepID=UPI00300E1F08